MQLELMIFLLSSEMSSVNGFNLRHVFKAVFMKVNTLKMFRLSFLFKI